MLKAKAKAHSNIALVKYWGKKDEELIIPFNNSISLTLNEFYTITEVEFSEEDEFILNDEIQADKERKKIFNFVDLFRKASNNYEPIKIKSKNYFPTAAGLASSASGFAALACALNALYELGLAKKDLSIMARKGSGSACRSIYGGIVEWEKGHSDDTSYAKKIDDANWDIGMIAVILNEKKKDVLSRAGMATTVKTCPFYESWVLSADKDIEDIKVAIKNKDIDAIGEIAEHSALKMHATMMATRPQIIYLQEESLKVMRLVESLRKEGLKCYYTMDAGPNVKIITNSKYKDAIMEKLEEFVDRQRLIYCTVGPDAQVLEVGDGND